MNRFRILILLLLSLNQSYCQSTLRDSGVNRQSIYLEFAGNGRSILCGNYERIFDDQHLKFLHFTARAGVGFTSRSIDSSGITNIPLEVTLLLGRKKHFLEAGIGYTVSLAKNFTDTTATPKIHYKSISGIYCFRLGYRFSVRDGVLVRFAPSLQLEQSPVWKLDLSWGVSIGVSFSAFKNIWD